MTGPALFLRMAAVQRAAAGASASKPVLYIPASRQEIIREKLVRGIYLIYHPEKHVAGTTESTDHWTFSFDIGNGHSLGLNIQSSFNQSYTANHGLGTTFIVSELDYLVETCHPRVVPVSVRHERTVGWYIDYLLSHKCFKYAFDYDRLGCQNWMKDTVQLLSEAGEIDKAESAVASDALMRIWPYPCS